MQNNLSNRYSIELNQTEVLSRDEEERLYPYLAKQEVKNQLVTANLRLAMKHAHRYAALYKMDKNDLIGEANMGLIEAINRFDPKRGFRFNTYAEHWIKKHILAYISSNCHIVNRGHSAFYKAQKATRLTNRGLDENAICDEMSLSSRQLSNYVRNFMTIKK